MILDVAVVGGTVEVAHGGQVDLASLGLDHLRGESCQSRVERGLAYRLDRDLSVAVVLEHVTVSNGLEWSPDGSLAYYNDTDTLAIAVFSYDREEGLTNRRRFVEIPDGPAAGRGSQGRVAVRGAARGARAAGQGVPRLRALSGPT